jgi:protein farnesyltransferase subunit beta
VASTKHDRLDHDPSGCVTMSNDWDRQSHTIVHRSPARQSRAAFKVETLSTVLQEATEAECRPYFVDLASLPASQLDHLRETGILQGQEHQEGLSDADGCEKYDNQYFPFKVALLRSKHIEYVSQLWTRPLKASFVSLDASQPWMMYWCLQSCDLLSHEPSEVERENILSSLKRCWSNQSVKGSAWRERPPPSKGTALAFASGNECVQGGGFGGGPGQLPHAANTYAGVLVLCILSTSPAETEAEPPYPTSVRARALEYMTSLREPLAAWLSSLQQQDGSFRMHEDGEVDVRATYCAAVVASLLRLGTSCIDRRSASAFVASCQTYEGGFGGEPFSEAHGGYTFCALASMILLQEGCTNDRDSGLWVERLRFLIDVPNMLGWLSRRQMGYEGGFQGRTNKLVDGCYSFWQGAAAALASRLATADASSSPSSDTLLDLHDFATSTDRILFDTAMLERYILLCAQEVQGGLRDKPSAPRDFYHSCYNLSGLSIAQISGIEYGHREFSRVAQTHPVYNIRVDRVLRVRSYFANQ